MISDEKAREAYSKYKEQKKTVKQLAKEYGTYPADLYKAWKKINSPETKIKEAVQPPPSFEVLDDVRKQAGLPPRSPEPTDIKMYGPEGDSFPPDTEIYVQTTAWIRVKKNGTADVELDYNWLDSGMHGGVLYPVGPDNAIPNSNPDSYLNKICQLPADKYQVVIWPKKEISHES